MSAPSTVEVIRNLSNLAQELNAVVNMLRDAEMDAVAKRHKADMTESRAFLNAEGPMEVRKHTARDLADKDEEAALVAEAVVRTLRLRLKAIETCIDIGRSMNAAHRAEAGLTAVNT